MSGQYVEIVVRLASYMFGSTADVDFDSVRVEIGTAFEVSMAGLISSRKDWTVACNNSSCVTT